MASNQRIKGQEATITITRGGTLEDTLSDIFNFNVQFEGEIKKKGYLGEKTDRTDDVYRGVKGDFEMHTHTQDWLRFWTAIADRMKRNTPDLVINISVDLLYPNLDNPTIFLPDVKFGELGVGLPDRTEYVGKKIAFACDDYDLTLS
jgi:hypothetical protein